jgi:hypothetical protein
VELPATIRVKLSSEAARTIALTRVVIQEMPLRDLMDHLLAAAGKDEGRIREFLARGSLVSGSCRLRWEGWDAEPESLRALLAAFPDPDPSIAFSGERCVRVVLRGGRPIEVARQAACFWKLLLEMAAASADYAGYCYRNRADRYLKDFSAAETERLRTAAEKVRFTTVRRQLQTTVFRSAELYTTRA